MIWGVLRKQVPASLQIRLNSDDQPAAASSAALQEGEHTAWDLPSILRVTICERARCLPHRKHDIVAAPNDVAAVKGEPDTLDL